MDQERKLTHSTKELTTTTEIRKILEKEILMKKFMVLLQLTPTFFQCQEEEDKLLMLQMDQERKLTHSLKETRKILVKETLMKKFMVLLLLILTFSQSQEEE